MGDPKHTVRGPDQAAELISELTNASYLRAARGGLGRQVVTEMLTTEVQCPACGALFAVPTIVARERQNATRYTDLWCPSGHNFRLQDTALEKYRKETDAATTAQREWQERADSLTSTLQAERLHRERLERTIRNMEQRERDRRKRQRAGRR